MPVDTLRYVLWQQTAQALCSHGRVCIVYFKEERRKARC